MSKDQLSPRAATRAPLENRVRLQFDDAVDVIEALCTNISIGGMQVATDNPRPQGTLVRFDLEMEEGVSVRGLGEVVWMRAAAQGPGRDPGMGIKFRFIEQRDRQMIFKIVSEHIKERLAHKHPPLETPAGALPEADAPLVPQVGDGVPAGDFRDEEPAREIDEPLAPPAPPFTPESRWQEDLEPPSGDSFQSDVPDFAHGDTFDDDPGDAGLGERQYRLNELYHPRPARRREFPVLPVVLLLLLVGVVIVYVYWDDLVGPSTPPVTVSAGLPDAGPAPDAAGEAPDLGAGKEAPAPVGEEPPLSLPDDGQGTESRGAPATAPPPPEPAPPPPAPPPPAPPPPRVRAFTLVENISWTRTPGGVKISIETNGAIPQERYSHFRLEGESPREVVKLTGVAHQYPRSTIPVTGSPVSQIRVGYHPGPKELHVVLDMLDRSTRIARLRAQGSTLEVYLE